MITPYKRGISPRAISTTPPRQPHAPTGKSQAEDRKHPEGVPHDAHEAWFVEVGPVVVHVICCHPYAADDGGLQEDLGALVEEREDRDDFTVAGGRVEARGSGVPWERVGRGDVVGGGRVAGLEGDNSGLGGIGEHEAEEAGDDEEEGGGGAI